MSKKTKKLIIGPRKKSVKQVKAQFTLDERDLKVPVTRKFLLNFADSIFDPKHNTFLKLCKGKLQNGPDPDDQERTMHCGLGELYYAMTGLHPYEGHGEGDVTESRVVALAVKRSTLNKKHFDAFEKDKEKRKAPFKAAIATIEKLKLEKHLLQRTLEPLKDELNSIDTYDEFVADEVPILRKFRLILDRIPKVNDGVKNTVSNEGVCTLAGYKTRAKKVAAIVREAAKLLPR